MTKDEAVVLTKIAWTVDGWCSTCAIDILEQMAVAFPEHADTFTALCDPTIRDRLQAATDAWESGGCVGPEPYVWTV